MNPVITFLIKLLEAMFVVGVLGSLAVIAVTTVEDIEVVLDKHDEETPQAATE
jgi:hypothetical protein